MANLAELPSTPPIDVTLSKLGFERPREMKALVDHIRGIPPPTALESPDPAQPLIKAFHEMGEKIVDEATRQGRDPNRTAYHGKMAATVHMYRESGREIQYKEEAFDLLTSIYHSGQTEVLNILLENGVLDKSVVEEWEETS